MIDPGVIPPIVSPSPTAAVGGSVATSKVTNHPQGSPDPYDLLFSSDSEGKEAC